MSIMRLTALGVLGGLTDYGEKEGVMGEKPMFVADYIDEIARLKKLVRELADALEESNEGHNLSESDVLRLVAKARAKEAG